MKLLIDIPMEVQQELIRAGLYHNIDVSEAVVHYLELGLEHEKQNKLGHFEEIDDENNDCGC